MSLDSSVVDMILDLIQWGQRKGLQQVGWSV